MKKKINAAVFKKNNIVLIIIFIFFICAILQILYLNISPIINGINLKNFVSNRNTKIEVLEASRGTIFDSSGKILSQNVTAYTVIAYLDPKRSEKTKDPIHVIDKTLTAEKLASVLNMTKEDIEKILNPKDYAYQVEIGPGGRGISELMKEEINKLQLPGIDFIKTYKRYYPSGDFLSYTVGYAVNKEEGIVGEMGVESFYNDELKGKNGSKQFQKDLYGFKIPNTKELIKQPINGKDVYLTINNDIQMFIENAVKTAGTTFDPEFISLTVMDAKTGKILGTSAYPSFDPNLRNMTNYLNPLTSFAYEPGSTMKIFTYMAAMEKGVYKGSDTFMSGSKEFKNGNETIKISDWNQTGWGRIDYDTGFALSSNMGIANLLDGKINKEDLKIYYEKFGFGSKTGIELPKELPGKIDFKYEVEVVNAGFGQGITTTPIQNLQALTTLANDGVMIRPQIIEKIVDPKTGEIEYESKKQELGKIVTHSTVEKIKSLMYRVINDPKDKTTGNMYKIDNYDIIGKTGTAQIFDNKTGKYMEGKFDSIYSFSGMFPYDNPQIIVYAALKRPKFGGVSALAPAVKTVIEDVAKYYNIYKEDEVIVNDLKVNLPSFINKNIDDTKKFLTDRNIKNKTIGTGDKVIYQYPQANNISLKNDQVILITNDFNIKVPDFNQLSLKEATSICTYLNYNCKYEGTGYVVDQSIKTNEIYNNELNLKFESKYNPSS